MKDIKLAPWDTHPNEKGHRLIAAALYEQIALHRAELGFLGTPDR